MQRGKNAHACVVPRVAEEFAPAQFVDQLVLHLQRVLFQNARQHFAQRDQAVGQVRRQARDSALEMVAGTRIGCRLHAGNTLEGGTPGWY